MPKNCFYLKNNSNLFSTSWSYFLFMEYIMRNNNINNVIMYSQSISTTSFPDSKYGSRVWHNRPAFTLFLVLPLSDFSDKGYYTLFFCIFQVFLRIGFVGFLKFFLHIPLCFTFYINIEICQHLNADFTNFILFRR